MNDKTIGTTLRNAREKVGIKVPQVSEYLINKNHKAAIKTIYSWEKDKSMPDIDAFLDMCELYKIDDILQEFGYSDLSSDKVVDFPRSEQEKDMLIAFHKLNDTGKETAIHQVNSLSGIKKLSAAHNEAEAKKISSTLKNT